VTYGLWSDMLGYSMEMRLENRDVSDVPRWRMSLSVFV